jgi:raffinose/stachyose/melibiose transport system permease protein
MTLTRGIAADQTSTKAPAPRRRASRIPSGNYLYLLPAVVLLSALVYFSVVYTVWLSAQSWNGFGPDRVFIGIQNYGRALADPIFWRSMLNVIGFLALIFVQMVLGLVFAVLLNGRIALGVLYRIALFLPVVLAPAVMAPVFREIFSPSGQINGLLTAIGLESLTHAWLADPNTAIFALAAISVWAGTGFSFILYFAALTQVDPQIFEAARVDGAGNIRVFVSIIVPLVRSTNVTLIVLGTIGTIKMFDIPQIITGGGPANSTQFPATYIYQQGITNYNAGYGAALTVVLVLLCGLLAAWQLRLNGRVEKQG